MSDDRAMAEDLLEVLGDAGKARKKILDFYAVKPEAAEKDFERLTGVPLPGSPEDPISERLEKGLDLITKYIAGAVEAEAIGGDHE